MQDNPNLYSYAGALIHTSKKSFFDPTWSRTSFVAPKAPTINDKALEKAAKKICNLQCGRCPIQEEHFSGCSVDCDEEVRPWRCWVDHFKTLARRVQSPAK